MPHFPAPELISKLARRAEPHPNARTQVFVQSEESNRHQTSLKDDPVWTGILELGRVSKEDYAGVVEGWLSSFNGQDNTSDFPIKRFAIPEATTISGSTTRSDGWIEHTVADATDFKVGHYFTAGDKLYIIAQLDGSRIVCNPQRTIANGTAITPADSIKARLTDSEHPDSPRIRGFWGPWTIPWEEA